MDGDDESPASAGLFAFGGLGMNRVLADCAATLDELRRDLAAVLAT